ncbi:hypothetical protein SDC9_86410 [bioreactor metagenome]|uniref:Uncharacterized protein n=1 Tax=bioreactor metagenome TaxID=1076179 RepID=A0A644ZFW1_9ZZZZ
MGLSRLPVVLRLAQIDIVHQDARHLHLLGLEGFRLDDALHLADDDAAAGLGRLGRRQLAELVALLIDGDVTVFIGHRAANDGDVYPGQPIQQPFLAVDFQQLHQVVLGRAVHPAAAVPGVHHGAQPDLCDHAGLFGRDIAVHGGHYALREIIDFGLILPAELSDAYAAAQHMAAHQSLGQSLVADVVHPPVVAVSDGGREIEGEVPGMTRFQEALFKLHGGLLGKGA